MSTIILPACCFAQDSLLTTSIHSVDSVSALPMIDRLPALNSGRMYHLKPAVDIPIIAVGSLWSGYAFTKIYGKERISDAAVMSLDKKNLNSLDRWAAGNSNPTLAKNSDYLFYGSMPLPVFLMIDRKIRKDALVVGALYWESFAITGMLYTGATYFFDRYRPETYNTGISMIDRGNGNNKNSFFAGHVAVVANATFFMAKIYSDYHPESNWKWAFWGGAAAATGTMVYFRHASGKHFPTDLLLGTAVGTLSGILVPHFHKNADMKKQAWRVSPSFDPYSGGTGLSFTYTIK